MHQKLPPRLKQRSLSLRRIFPKRQRRPQRRDFIGQNYEMEPKRQLRKKLNTQKTVGSSMKLMASQLTIPYLDTNMVMKIGGK